MADFALPLPIKWSVGKNKFNEENPDEPLLAIQVPVESIEDKNYGKPIAQPALEAVVGKMMNLAEKYPTLKDEVINKFKKQYGITTETIGPTDIRTAEQGQFLTLLINEIDSTL